MPLSAEDEDYLLPSPSRIAKIPRWCGGHESSAVKKAKSKSDGVDPAPSLSATPSAVLKTDILKYILTLATREHGAIPVIFIAASVCRQWRGIVYVSPELWLHADFSRALRFPSYTDFKEILSRPGSMSCRSVKMSGSASIDFIECVLSTCKQLENIHLSRCNVGTYALRTALVPFTQSGILRKVHLCHVRNSTAMEFFIDHLVEAMLASQPNTLGSTCH